MYVFLANPEIEISNICSENADHQFVVNDKMNVPNTEQYLIRLFCSDAPELSY